MKKLILLLIFIPLVSFGQNDFRKMFWGESKEVLKEKYPDVEFFPAAGIGFLTQWTEFPVVLEIEAQVFFMFKDDKLVGGMYAFNPMAAHSRDERLKEFNNVSERLNAKYELQREDVWYKDYTDAEKNKPDWLDLAVEWGEVQLLERGEKEEGVTIVHILDKNHHTLAYMTKEGLQVLDKTVDDAF
jgi:hypothetical protein